MVKTTSESPTTALQDIALQAPALASTDSPQTRIAVVVCSVGRPDCLANLLLRLSLQTHRAHRVVLVVTAPEDAPAIPPGVTVLIAPKGLPRQRNRGLDAVLGDSDVVAFFDDDYVPARGALAGIARAFAAWPDVDGITGHLIADGIGGPGLEPEAANRLADAWEADVSPEPGPLAPPEPRRGLYGCNMAFRATAIGTRRFDERLPLYGWQEDIDFANRLAGRRVKTDAFAGVHCGVKRGRETAGRRLGYSQIANPLYLARKGTMPSRFALKLALRCLLANHLRLLRPEAWIDRRGRARGNRIALVDALRGRAAPERILNL